jgi:hypothetical protein
MLADLKMYGRFALGLRAFLRHRMSLAEAEMIVRQRMAERDTNFLRLMEKGIYSYSKSPYRPLLEMAGCQLGDIRNMVRAKGLEATLLELREVRSFGKLTGEGVTLVGSEMVHILEKVLPARFGGSPLDYQLLEEEDQQGFTRLSLLVSPKIQIRDESEVIAAVLEALKGSSTAAQLAGELWKQAKTLRIRRQEPIMTARGKFMPLCRTKLSQ